MFAQNYVKNLFCQNARVRCIFSLLVLKVGHVFYFKIKFLKNLYYPFLKAEKASLFEKK